MSKQASLLLFVILGITSLAVGDDDPGHVRHELMEGVGDAAKPIGAMFEGELDYDETVVRGSLTTFEDASAQLGGLVPPGSEGGEAAPAIWEDRAGFEEAIAVWGDAIEAAKAADLATFDAAQPALGEVFNACKNCHDSYRISED